MIFRVFVAKTLVMGTYIQLYLSVTEKTDSFVRGGQTFRVHRVYVGYIQGIIEIYGLEYLSKSVRTK
jgi:hypothetical protein